MPCSFCFIPRKSKPRQHISPYPYPSARNTIHCNFILRDRFPHNSLLRDPFRRKSLFRYTLPLNSLFRNSLLRKFLFRYPFPRYPFPRNPLPRKSLLRNPSSLIRNLGSRPHQPPPSSGLDTGVLVLLGSGVAPWPAGLRHRLD